MEGKQLQPQQEQPTTPARLIELAVKGNADLDQLEKLLNLQRDYEANEARKAFHKAMAAFGAHAPKIMKDKKVGYQTDKGKVGYSHASLANVVETIRAELSKHGLSASWTTKQNGSIIVTCKITHELGHSEETSLSAAADNSGSKNSIQAIGSTITYLERYTLLALTGLATRDQDDDGQAVAGKPPVEMPKKKDQKAEPPAKEGASAARISASQIYAINALLSSLSVEKKAEYLGGLGVTKVEELTMPQAAAAIQELNKKKGAAR